MIATADGATIYVAAWSGKQIIEIDRKTGKQTATDVAFFPDNLNWSADKRTILATGIAGIIPGALDCFCSVKVNCPETGVRVDRFDPATLESGTVVASGVYGKFEVATGAIDFGEAVWVNSFCGDRITIFASLNA